MIEFDAKVDEVEEDSNPRWDESTQPSTLYDNYQGQYAFLKGVRQVLRPESSNQYNNFVVEAKFSLALSQSLGEYEFFKSGKTYHVTIEEVTP